MAIALDNLQDFPGLLSADFFIQLWVSILSCSKGLFNDDLDTLLTALDEIFVNWTSLVRSSVLLFDILADTDELGSLLPVQVILIKRVADRLI